MEKIKEGNRCKDAKMQRCIVFSSSLRLCVKSSLHPKNKGGTSPSPPNKNNLFMLPI